MNLAGLATSLAAIAAVDAGSAVAGKIRRVGWYASAGILFLSAYITGAACLVAWLATRFELWAAFGVAAAAFLVLAGVVLVLATIAEQAHKRREHELETARHDALLAAVTSIGGDASTKAMIGAALVGLASGALFRRS